MRHRAKRADYPESRAISVAMAARGNAKWEKPEELPEVELTAHGVARFSVMYHKSLDWILAHEHPVDEHLSWADALERVGLDDFADTLREAGRFWEEFQRAEHENRLSNHMELAFRPRMQAFEGAMPEERFLAVTDAYFEKNYDWAD